MIAVVSGRATHLLGMPSNLCFNKVLFFSNKYGLFLIAICCLCVTNALSVNLPFSRYFI
jgi:hypothetical protein